MNNQLTLLICQKIITETHDVKTFIFSLSKPFHFLAGQHIKFTLTINNKQHHCCYTLSSDPNNTDYISITIKRVIGGIASNYFHDSFAIGNTIKAHTPSGNFHLPETIPNKILLLSAGSGITPMLSLLRFMTSSHYNTQVVFLHSARTERDLIAKTEISALAKQHGNCQIVYTLTQDSSAQWLGYQGRLSKNMIANIHQLIDYDVFVCGPKLFRKTAQQLLRESGLKRENYHYESFGERPVTQTVAPKQHADVVIKTKPKLHFSKWNKHHIGNAKDTLLEQGEAAGLILPYSCRGGSCGSCKAKLISGEVTGESTEGLSQEEQDQGYILLCSCTPLSDVEVAHDKRR
jgi:ferredoxin-NADP reductase